MKHFEINEPISGLYADPDVKRAFNHLIDEVENFVPADRSYDMYNQDMPEVLFSTKRKVRRRFHV
jgi:hypothetical protein